MGELVRHKANDETRQKTSRVHQAQSIAGRVVEILLPLSDALQTIHQTAIVLPEL